MDGGIRPGVWIAAALAGLAAIAVFWLASPAYDGEPHRQPARVASPDRSQAAPAAEPAGVRPAAARLSAPSEPPRSEARQQPVQTPAPSQEAASHEGFARGLRGASDSRVASDLRILESEAERRAASLGLAVPAPPGATAAQGPAAQDARRAAAADAVLVDYLMQDAYRGTEFPIGYPAEEVTRSAAESMVAALSPERRQSLLEVALQTLGGDRMGPRFDPYQIWEGTALPR